MSPSISGGPESSGPGSGKPADPRAGRVAEMHRQTRPGLALAGGFALAAVIAAFVPHNTGPWLPLHLFLAGSLLMAICTVTVMLAVTWSSAPAPPSSVVRVQRALLITGVVGLTIARELGSGPWPVVISATLLAASLVILAAILVRVRQSAVVDRFHPAIDGYLAALFMALVGSSLGVGAATGKGDITTISAHLTINLLGLVGVVIAATLPYMTSTQLRCKMAPRATPVTLRAILALLVVATTTAALGLVVHHPITAAVGLVLYAAGIVATVAVCPRPKVRNIRWAGPRVGQLGLGVLWWLGTCIALAVHAASATSSSSGLIVALVVGGYAQILAGSLAYLVPVVRGGGHIRLADGFRITRSWLGLIAANAAAIGAITGSSVVTLAGIGVFLCDSAVRTVLLTRPTPEPP